MSKYEFVGRVLYLQDQAGMPVDMAFDIPDDYQLLGITGTTTPTAVWVRMTPALDTQLKFDLDGAVNDSSDFPE